MVGDDQVRGRSVQFSFVVYTLWFLSWDGWGLSSRTYFSNAATFNQLLSTPLRRVHIWYNIDVVSTP